MSPREQLLQAIEQGLSDQVISKPDLENILYHTPNTVEQAAPPKSDVSITDVLFYLAGIIFFAALMTMVSQVGDDSLGLQLLISLGAGLTFWAAAYALARQPAPTDTKAGLLNSLLLTGSLSVIAGGLILTFDLSKNLAESAGLVYAVTFVILATAHWLFDRILRNAMLIVFSLMLFVAAFPAAMEGLLAPGKPPVDVWGVVAIVTGLLLAYGGKLVSVSATGRGSFKDSFESVAAFIVLAVIYQMEFVSHIGLLWELLLPFVIYLAFFVSIKRRSTQFLLTGSLFLVLFLITISFKYFSGLGAVFSLILSACSILATAFVALGINKKYIKRTG